MSRFGRLLRLVGRATLGTVIVLVVVPTAINVQTGGTAPPFLAPYQRWLWPAVGVLVAVVVALELWEPVRGLFAPVNARRPDDPHNVPNALRQVHRYVRQRVSGSLADRVRVELALEERPDVVLPPANLVQRVSDDETAVPPGTPISELFDRMQHSMLILGAPGAGKTTLLLDLAGSLAAAAGTRVVPVLVDLAEWSSTQHPRRLPLRRQPPDFQTWLLETVERRYRIPVPVGRAWLEDGRLGLLLDGLDEVRPDHRDQCVQEIDALQRQYPVPQLALCCREADYATLSRPLRTQGAVTVHPLDRNQVVTYLARAELAPVREALEADPELWDLLTSPLTLSIMALVYGTRPPGTPAGGDVADRRRELFDAYLVEMVARRAPALARARAGAILRRLRLLARTTVKLDAGTAIRVPPLTIMMIMSSPRVSWIVGAAMRPAALVGFLGAAVYVIAHAYGLLTAVPVAVALTAGAMMFLNAARPRRPAGVPAVRLAAAAAGTAVASAALGTTVVAAGRGLAAALTLLPGWLAVTFLICVPPPLLTFVVQSMRRRGRRPPVKLVVGTAGVAVAAVLWLFGLASAATGFGLALAVTTLALVLPLVLTVGGHGSPPGWRRASWPLAAVTTTAGIAALATDATAKPLTVGHPVNVALWLVVSLPLAVVLAGRITALVGRPLTQVLFLTAGEPWPWHRRFWRFAADCGVLTGTDNEYRFIHILVRDHLAACDPQVLASALRERAEQQLAAVYRS